MVIPLLDGKDTHVVITDKGCDSDSIRIIVSSIEVETVMSC